MKKYALLLLPAMVLNFNVNLRAQGTAFTYQGQLLDGSNPANGSYDLRFGVYAGNIGGSSQGPILTNTATPVSNGLFIVSLDFGNQFPGADRWLEIGVRTNGGASFVTLNPRQMLTPTPYAITAASVVSGGLAAGAYGNAVTLNNANNSFSGSFSGNGANVANVNAATLNGLGSSNFWKAAGNSGTSAATNFLGTVDNQSLNLRVNNLRAFHLEPTVNDTSHSNIVNVLGGSPVNLISNGVYGATIGGGGGANYFNEISTNIVSGDFGTVGGGLGNTSSGLDATVGGGHANVSSGGAATIGGGFFNNSTSNSTTVAGGAFNTASGLETAVGGGQYNLAAGDYSAIAGGNSSVASGPVSFIGGGENNTNSGQYGFIGGGSHNSLLTSVYSFIGGGALNLIQANVNGGAIVGGEGNLLQSGAWFGLIGGGFENQIQTNTGYSVVAGGYQNVVLPNASGSAISGGFNNVIGTSAISAGIGSGYFNAIGAGANGSFIGGGSNNLISVGATFATIGGGIQNQADGSYDVIGGGTGNSTSGIEATVSGGNGNSAADACSVGGGALNTAAGVYSTVPGGAENTAAGSGSLAAGVTAEANHDNTFVWSDGNTSVHFASTARNQFLIHADGGVGIGTNAPDSQLHVASASSSPELHISQNTPSDYTRLRMNVTGYPFWEMDVSPGSTPELGFWNVTERMRIDYTGNVYATSFNPSSDRNIKENFSDVSPRDVLDKVAALPITRWNFKEDKASEHLGPMAQDFRAAFGLGTDEKHIATVDEGGVALAAIQGLNQKLEERTERLETELKRRDADNEELKERLAKLEELLSAARQ
ncbi:MAG TPA: tail fiber domain-containing protein [Verrucomicrobiae bacterium]|jgi:hypothetical protein|nr:tail fiber domain-containing protein [Verrucomicrobiae bacterium]